jgi:hypothetical protein
MGSFTEWTMGMSAILGIFCSVLAQDDASHFPLPDGARWVYTSRETRYNTRIGEPGPPKEGPKRVLRCVRGKDSATLGGPEGVPAQFFVTPAGVYQSRVEPGNLILKFPLKKFDDWGPGEPRNGLPRFANHGQSEIEISGKKYLCWKITETRSQPKSTQSWTRWYAPGVGLVSEESTEERDGAVTKRVADLETFEQPATRK